MIPATTNPKRASSSKVSSIPFCAFERLRAVSLRPTRQRLALCNLIFGKGERHFSAEGLYEEALQSREIMSLATVYNTLRQFSDVGLIRPLQAQGHKTFFDTNTSDHHHFLVEQDGALVKIIDIPGGRCRIIDPPQPPDGFEVIGTDVMIRLRSKC